MPPAVPPKDQTDNQHVLPAAGPHESLAPVPDIIAQQLQDSQVYAAEAPRTVSVPQAEQPAQTRSEQTAPVLPGAPAEISQRPQNTIEAQNENGQQEPDVDSQQADEAQQPIIPAGPETATTEQQPVPLFALPQHDTHVTHPQPGTVFLPPDVNQEDTTPVHDAPVHTHHKKSSKWLKRGLVAGAVCFAVVIAGYLVTKVPASEAVAVSNKFIAAIQADKPSAAYALTSKTFQKSANEVAMATAVHSETALLQGKPTVIDTAITKIDGQSQKAIIVYALSDAKPKYIKVVLENVGAWQVLNFYSGSTPFQATVTNN